MERVIVSSSGKVLITGGYLILEPEFSGISLGLDSQFYCLVQPSNEVKRGTIEVKSLQFEDGAWRYEIKNGKLYEMEGGEKNKFVYSSLEVVFRYVSFISQSVGTLELGIKVYLAADNDFYSQNTKLVGGNQLVDIPPCDKFTNSLAKVAKTGLGSSATLVTSIVSSMLVYLFQAKQLDLELCHRLAQVAHCRAQGKVGSGFDVASAIFGSINYTRFNPTILNGWLEFDNRTEGLEKLLEPTTWDFKATSINLPPFISLKLVEVYEGSDTRSMVKSLLHWRTNNQQQASQIWQTLHTNNLSVNQLFHQLNQLYNQDKDQYETELKNFPKGSSPTVELLKQVQNAFKVIRQQYQKLTLFCQVPIEPKQQTKRLDYILQHHEKVLAAGVPGAGGNDALFVLYIQIDTHTDPTTKLEAIVNRLDKCTCLLARPLVNQNGTQLLDENSSMTKVLTNLIQKLNG